MSNNDYYSPPPGQGDYHPVVPSQSYPGGQPYQAPQQYHPQPQPQPQYQQHQQNQQYHPQPQPQYQQHQQYQQYQQYQPQPQPQQKPADRGSAVAGGACGVCLATLCCCCAAEELCECLFCFC